MIQEQQEQQDKAEKREFLPLGSIVILNGSIKKLVVVSRGSIVEGAFFDYGAFLYPEGLIDTNIAYFNHSDIHAVVHEGYTDQDNDLALEILSDAYARFQRQGPGEVSAPEPAAAAPVAPVAQAAEVVDLFASVRDIGDDDE